MYVRVYDPVAMNECRRRIGDKVYYAGDMYDAVLDADALLMLTEMEAVPPAQLGRVGKVDEDTTYHRRPQHLRRRGTQAERL